MSEKFKNTVLAVLLICLCFMIKCKLDKDKAATDGATPEATTMTDMKQAEKNPTESQNEVKDTAIADKQIPQETRKEEKEVVKEEVAPANPKPSNKTVPATKKAPKKKQPPKKKYTPSKKPKIQFDELVWDFGEITEGDIVEKKFKFTNTGNAPLEIIATSATCGCTRPSFPFLDIAPGESNVIGVHYNSVGKDGVQTPEVTVESNTEPKITIIKLKGIVKPKPKKEIEVDSTKLVKDSTEVKQ